MHFVKILAKIDRNGLIIGGQYDQYNEEITKFFHQLRDWNAKLVFFCRPYLNFVDKEAILHAYDHAEQFFLHKFTKNQSDIGRLFPLYLDKRFLYNLMQICSKYGEVKTHSDGITFKIVEIQDQLSRYKMTDPNSLHGRNQNFVEFSKTHLYFAYGLAVELVSANQALAYIDLRRHDSEKFIDEMNTIPTHEAVRNCS